MLIDPKFLTGITHGHEYEIRALPGVNEVGVGSGWKVYIDLDNDSVLDSNEVFATTDANGAWTLSGLAAGTYKVRQVLLTGWKQTTPSNNYGLNVTLAANQVIGGKLFGSKKIA